MFALVALASLLGSALAMPGFSRYMSPLESISSGCATTGVPASCQNATAQTNLCCFEAPGGLIMQTQFWDTDPSTGPSNSWTIHGLWPNNCDGTYEEDCDPSRDYTNISGLLEAQGATSTLDYMQEYWLNDDGTSEELWEHEWATHGTCYSTLQVDCLPEGSPEGAEAVAFFETVVRLFKTLPTYEWLEAAGITPSKSKKHSLSSLLLALSTGSGGYTPALNCDGSTLDAISWYFNLKGSVIDGDFILIDAPQAGSCSDEDILYPPKSSSSK